MKLLQDNPRVQAKLFEEIKAHFKDVDYDSLPPREALAHAHIDYLEATMAEVLRIGLPAGTLQRTAIKDTVILGKRIPAGTTIGLAHAGEAYHFEENIPVDPSTRTLPSKGLRPVFQNKKEFR